MDRWVRCGQVRLAGLLRASSQARDLAGRLLGIKAAGSVELGRANQLAACHALACSCACQGQQWWASACDGPLPTGQGNMHRQYSSKATGRGLEGRMPYLHSARILVSEMHIFEQ